MRFGFWEILLIVVLIFILFGAKNFPAMMKNLADGIKVFKKEIKTADSKPAASKEVAAKKGAIKKVAVKKTAVKKVSKKK